MRQYMKFLAPVHWPMWFGLTLLRLSALLPYRSMLWLSHRLGGFVSRVLPKRRRIAETNVRLCMPQLSEKEVEQLARASIDSAAMSFFETALAWWGSDKRLRKMVIFEGTENIDEARKGGKGVIMLGGHYTTLEISGRLLTFFMKDFHPVYMAAKNELYNTVMIRRREKTISTLLENSEMRKIIATLKKGEAIWYAPDQDFGRKGSVFAPFMDVQTSTIVATSKLAKLSGAAVVPFYSERLGNGQYVVRFGKMLDGFPSGDDVNDATMINRAIEEQVRRAPEQYLWLHRRFKTRPEGEPNIYS
ncbi:MAG: LpxL/LpxP family Kdo(2)-lipid IV(A) lauroyl/palmitoleoyl acyltransferase [Gammaproteobacteria bacterium]|nr:LpxL/LpxP family Kdo(2)-lipid IV(A) lauroyl/palmitoleoyl acyltransferase [Gammaproteobacteria bacterium]